VKKAWKLTVPLFVLSVCGAYISLLLLDKHLLESHGPRWFAAVCGDEPAEPDTDVATTQPDADQVVGAEEPSRDRKEADRKATRQPGNQATREEGGREARGKRQEVGRAVPAAAEPSRDRQEAETTEVARHGLRGGADCDSVLASRWGTIPPRPKDDNGAPGAPKVHEGLLGLPPIPSAYLGFVYFTSLAIWFLFIGRASLDRVEWYRIPLAFMICGVCFALFFTYIMFTQTEEWCPWCMVTHVINVMILAGMILLRPKKAEALAVAPAVPAESRAVDLVASSPESNVGEGAEPEPAPLDELARQETAARADSHAVRSHPSYRLVATCVLLSAATCAMVWNGYAVLVEQAKSERVRKELDAFRKDTALLAAIYRQAPKVKIPIRPDDPQIAEGEFLCPLVVFSDFQCPACSTFARLLEKRIQPLFHNHLRITWKHFPLSTECNKKIKYNSHPQACEAARATEAARMQGGSEAFWKAHDLLFVARKRLKGMDYRALAEELGLDPVQFEADMYSEATTARIAEDVTLGKSLGVRGTPSVFLSGRRVESKLLRIMPFWQMVAQQSNFLRDKKIYARKERQRKAGQAPAATSQPATPPATPDTPGHSGAP